MNFDWTDDERRFRAELRATIERHIRPGWNHEHREMEHQEDIDAVLEFCKALGSEGYLTPHWPKQFGGREASPWEQAIISEETWRAGEPRGPQYMNTNWIGPAIMVAGTQEQKDYHLPRIAAGDVMWCQGFSEPDAGSDLASLKTRAVRDGDAYIVNGQKIWTSYAHSAEWCFLLTRTDPNSDKWAGITILLVPMNSPGVEVRDIPTPFTPHLIHEMFFTDVVVPVANRLGDENKGWDIVRTVLANERVGIARHAHCELVLDRTLADAAALGVDIDDPSLVEVIGMAYAHTEAARAMNYAAVNERVHDPNGARPLASVSRAITGPMEAAIAVAAQKIMGENALLHGYDADRQVMMGTAAPIAAGSLEVQLNLISKMSLGLPRG
ncbi:MAG: acyl-CoA dehydrogenase family protein [Acidimicrobiia bacterium]